MNGKLEIEQTGFEQFDRATGVDGPAGAAALQFADQFHAGGIEHRIAVMRNEGAVEIGAEKANISRHEKW